MSEFNNSPQTNKISHTHGGFILSDKLDGGVILYEDVKEFIRLLKEELFSCDRVEDEEPVFEIIDKLAGDRLI
jgi:hypothetical protein